MSAADSSVQRLPVSFFRRGAEEVAEALVGKLLIRQTEAGERTLRISETEVYLGEADTACHASKGKTKRNAPLYEQGGIFYVYLCYGMHWMLNVVTGEKGHPQGVLIRACREARGPGKLTKALEIDGSFNGKTVEETPLFFAEDGYCPSIRRDVRIGIDYAEKQDRERLWRFVDAKAVQAKSSEKRRSAEDD